LNAWTAVFLEEMLHYLNYLDDNVKIRVVIITGEGRAFSSGLDLKDNHLMFLENVPEEYQNINYLHLKDIKTRNVIFQEMLGRFILKLRKVPQPIITAIKGPAYGGGFALALASDIRIAGESTVFCNAFINIGFSGADCGVTYWLPRLIGFSKAAEIIYTGREVYAQEADRIGLISKLVPDDQIMKEAIKTAKILVGKSFLGLKLTKEALNANIDAPSLENAIKLENYIQNVCGSVGESEKNISSEFLKRR
jgi:enoyl-CoA hydratase